MIKITSKSLLIVYNIRRCYYYIVKQIYNSECDI